MMDYTHLILTLLKDNPGIDIRNLDHLFYMQAPPATYLVRLLKDLRTDGLIGDEMTVTERGEQYLARHSDSDGDHSA